MKLYKMVYIGDEDSPRETFRQTEVMTEYGLKERLRQAIIDEQLCEDTLDHYGLNINTDCQKFLPEEVAEIFDYDGYDIDWQLTEEEKNG